MFNPESAVDFCTIAPIDDKPQARVVWQKALVWVQATQYGFDVIRAGRVIVRDCETAEGAITRARLLEAMQDEIEALRAEPNSSRIFDLVSILGIPAAAMIAEAAREGMSARVR